ncbi:MAG TPA: BolA family transcriptional regulator [Gammaproteobacteria bacterium]|nr:BolA family transcriptional regulator [Gammaproteobacteria bacterium]
MVTPEDIKGWIEQEISDCRVEITGDGQHFYAVIVSPVFADRSMVQQHQLVYRALGERMKAEIHALSMQTMTPEEYAVRDGAA